MLSKAVQDHFRCPEGFLDFGVAGALRGDAGYFQFGPDAIGYGRVSNSSRLAAVSPEPSPEVCDLLPLSAIEEGRVVLPFDPDEVIDNLRLERYAAGQWGAIEQALKKFYYRVRPFTNLTLRKHIKMFYSGRRKEFSFPRWPVDTSVENICERLLVLSLQAKRVDRIPFIWFWPEGACGSVMMTHDVETTAGRDLCPELLDINDSFGIKAAFEIVPEERYEVTPQFLNQLRDRGAEIVVQDLNHDGRLFDDRKEFLRRAAAINRYGREWRAKGFRSAVLYRKQEWYQDLEFSYDSSIPNVAHLDPQYGGCCTVMPYFIGNILELPVTTVQDYTLFHLLNEPGIGLWETQVESILAKNGLASFIVHPDYIADADKKLRYKSLLGYLQRLGRERNLWFAQPREVDSWWRARNRMSLLKDGESWRVVGDGADRAVVAFAKAVDGKIGFELHSASGKNTRLKAVSAAN
jgi:hypothetical protein